MSRRSRLIGLAIAVALLANGVANKASAGPGACNPVKACEAVKAAPAVPAVPACKPVKALPLPGACKPVKACEGVDAHSKHVVRQDRIARFASHFKKHGTGKAVYYYDAPKSAPSTTPPTPAPAPQSPAA